MEDLYQCCAFWPNFTKCIYCSDLLRQVWKITFAKDMCRRAQWASMYMYFTTFAFFFTLSAFKSQRNCNKKKPQLPYYWITKCWVLETPVKVLRESEGRCSARTPRLQAAGILVKGDTNAELFKGWNIQRSQTWEVGEWLESLESWIDWRQDEGTGSVEDERAEKAAKGERLQKFFWAWPLIPSFHVPFFFLIWRKTVFCKMRGYYRHLV